MRISSSRREEEFEINVIPLIDVLLTLLMFFVMTTTFVQYAGMKISLPEASPIERMETERPLTVMIDAEGRYFIDSNEVLNPALDTLMDALRQVAGDDRTRAVVLRADARTPHQAVITAMDALGQLGFGRLSLATTPSAKEAQ